MSRHTLGVPFFDALAMLSIAMVFLWTRLTAVSIRELGARAALTAGGHLRPRPDPAVEQALRKAFAELDRDLAEILGDRTVRGRTGR
jgi:hypothetical protein